VTNLKKLLLSFRTEQSGVKIDTFQYSPNSDFARNDKSLSFGFSPTMIQLAHARKELRKLGQTKISRS